MSFNLNKMLEKHTFTITCPKCNNKLSFNKNDIGKTIICKSCNSSVELIDNNFSNNINEVNNNIKDLFH